MPDESIATANVEAPVHEESQTLRETFREMVYELVECRELLYFLVWRNLKTK